MIVKVQFLTHSIIPHINSVLVPIDPVGLVLSLMTIEIVLNRRVFLLEGEAEKRENRLATEVSGLLRASMRADEQIKAKNTLEAAISNNEEDIDELENHLKVKLN